MDKKQWIGVAILCFVSLMFGCTSSGSNTKANDKPTFKRHSSGVPKYDNYFGRVYDLRYKLWKSDKKMSGIPSTLSGVLDVPKDMKDINIGNMLKLAAQQYGSKLLFQQGRGVTVKPDVKDPKAQKVATTLNDVYKTSAQMPKDMGDATTQSKRLVTQGQSLSQSAPRDFKGVNALKLPGVSAALADSTKELTKVPAQAGGIAQTALEVIKQFPALFRSKK